MVAISESRPRPSFLNIPVLRLTELLKVYTGLGKPLLERRVYELHSTIGQLFKEFRLIQAASDLEDCESNRRKDRGPQASKPAMEETKGQVQMDQSKNYTVKALAGTSSKKSFGRGNSSDEDKS
jgi:hypothetical protein